MSKGRDRGPRNEGKRDDEGQAKGGGGSSEEEQPYEEQLYDKFPPGAREGFGPDQGFNRWVRINDRRLFTADAQRDPVVNAFLDAPFSVNYAQFKSSHREAEYFIHKPHKAMTGQVDGIEGRVDGVPEDPQIVTLVMNHELSLARLITRSMTIEDGKQAAQIIHKQDDTTR